MKKIVSTTLLAGGLLFADVSTVAPFVGTVNYDSASNKSLKDKATFGGIYTSVGNLDYLLEFQYSYLDISYKNVYNFSDLKQHDITLVYGKYYLDYMYKIGGHYISNNEPSNFKDLGGGFMAILGIAGYQWYGYDKFTYGMDGYFSFYNSAHDEKTLTQNTNIRISQFTPFLSYTTALGAQSSNTIMLKGNFIIANDYIDSNYASFEVSDTYTYENFYLTARYFGGKMKSGIIDNGFTVYNTKDLMKDSYSLKLGYRFMPNLTADISYAVNNYEEYDASTLQLLPEGRRSVALLSVSYSY